MKEYYVLLVDKRENNSAATKAKKDVISICDIRGMEKFELLTDTSSGNSKIRKLKMGILAVFNWLRFIYRCDTNSILLFQHPFAGEELSTKFLIALKKDKKCRSVILIHDLETLREGIGSEYIKSKKAARLDNEVLNSFDYIICHNEKMKQYLIDKGFEESKLVCLGIFDYLTDNGMSDVEKGTPYTICIAGNLSKEKSAYIYKLIESIREIKVNLYGTNYSDINFGNCEYHGSFDADELPSILKGDFGVVWDGAELEQCSGLSGEYLKYNNPHKVSLYLTSGKPVIVWKQSAIYDFVKSHKVGIGIDSLFDLPEVLSNIDRMQYAILRKNAIAVSEQLRDGYYLNKALDLVSMKSAENRAFE